MVNVFLAGLQGDIACPKVFSAGFFTACFTGTSSNSTVSKPTGIAKLMLLETQGLIRIITVVSNIGKKQILHNRCVFMVSYFLMKFILYVLFPTVHIFHLFSTTTHYIYTDRNFEKKYSLMKPYPGLAGFWYR